MLAQTFHMQLCVLLIHNYPAMIPLQADIICLQEVDDKVFYDYLQPHLSYEGYSGHYTNKMGKVKEGSAMFWRNSRFSKAAHQDVLLRVRPDD